MRRLPRRYSSRRCGEGYPEGLSGNSIPIGSRIIALADAFDSIVSNRIYRNRLDYSDALQEIKNNSGTQFDPAVVSAFEDCFDEIISTIKQLDLIKYDD